MKIVISGASGFIGRSLCSLLSEHHEITALTRNPHKCKNIFNKPISIRRWNPGRLDGWEACLKNTDVIINLAGTNIADGRWTHDIKKKILESRVNTSHILLDAVKKTGFQIRTFLISSAIGFYGSGGLNTLDENSHAGSGFLSHVCIENEAVAKLIESHGIRTIIIRSGAVLDSSGGALAKMARPFKYFLGGYLGKGSQWMSWISLTDEISAIEFLIENQDCSGIFNLVSPDPVTNKEFSMDLAKILKRPCIFRIPSFMLRVIFGQMADELLLSGQKVVPKKLLEAGFEFKYRSLPEALKSIYSKST